MMIENSFAAALAVIIWPSLYVADLMAPQFGKLQTVPLQQIGNASLRRNTCPTTYEINFFRRNAVESPCLFFLQDRLSRSFFIRLAQRAG